MLLENVEAQWSKVSVRNAGRELEDRTMYLNEEM